jgi:hypothetical protein
MAFSLTVEQIRGRTKTVTRRIGWWFLKPGDLVMAVEKSRGLKKGERVKPIVPLRITSTRAETLDSVTQEEVDREGFPGLSPAEFITNFCATHGGCSRTTTINRIEFEFVCSQHCLAK